MYRPRELSSEEIDAQIQDFVSTAKLAKEAGYDGVEIMGSEGYLNQFIAKRTNHRKDEWGGEDIKRIKLPVEVAREYVKRWGGILSIDCPCLIWSKGGPVQMKL